MKNESLKKIKRGDILIDPNPSLKEGIEFIVEARIQDVVYLTRLLRNHNIIVEGSFYGIKQIELLGFIKK